MTSAIKRSLIVGSMLPAMGLMGCVSQSSYDDLNAKYQQSQQQNAALSAQVTQARADITRLQGAIKYTVNSDMLFASGGWEMRPEGKAVIAKLATQLAPSQQNKLVVNGFTDNAPIGPGLKAQGINTNQQLSQKRADTVMAYIISQGLKPDLISAHGYGEAQPAATNNTAQGRAANRRVELTLAGS